MKHILRMATGFLVIALVIVSSLFLASPNRVLAEESATSQASPFTSDAGDQNITDMLQGKHRIPQEIKQLYDNTNKTETPDVALDSFGATSITKITTNTTLSADKTYSGEVDIYPSVTFNVNHKTLTINGDLYIYGFVDLKGGTLKVNGNLIIASTSGSSIGQLAVGGGSVIVNKTLKSDSGNFISAGQLSMMNAADKVTITDGDFIAGGVDSRSYLGAGTIDINGNFAQLGILHQCAFTPENSLKVIIRGTASTPRDIYFDNPGESYFSNYQFATGTVLTPESILSLKIILSADTSMMLPDVLVYYFGSLNGHVLTLNGGTAYITSPYSSLNFGGGKVIANGTSGFGDCSYVQMSNAADIFMANGDFLAGSSYATLTNGKLEVNGDFYQIKTNNDANTFTPGPLYTTQFDKGNTNVSFENPNISYFTNLVLAPGASFTDDSVIPIRISLQQDIIDTPLKYPNLYLSGNLNGHTLTVDCDLTIVQTLDINGGRLLAKHNVAANGCLKMKNDADYVCVDGNYIIVSNAYNWEEITAGTLELKGDFLATPENPNSSYKTFVAGGTHKTILEGTNKRVIFGDPVYSHFANVEIADGTTFSSDSVISMYTEFTKDYTFNIPTLYLSGSLRGHTVNVNGNLYAMTYLSMDKGTLNVSGNLMTNGNLYMRNVEDIVHVKGNYTTTGTNYSTLTKGTLYIEGNFHQSGASGLFTASSLHKTVFCGTGPQAISLDAPAASKFGIVDIANDKVTYTSLPCDSKIISCTNLSDISATNGTLYPALSMNTLNYIMTVPKGTVSTVLSVSTPNGNEIVTMDGTAETSKQIDNIPYGGNIPITISVTTPGSMIIKTYTVKVEQLNTDISDIALTNGSLDKPFDPDTLDYTIDLTASTETIGLTPTIGNPDSSFTIDGQKAAAKTLSIHPGETKTCEIQVTGQDGATTKTYTFSIHRAPLIDNIEITGGTLSPAFAYATDTYRVDLPITDSNITISVSKSANCDMLTMDGIEQNSMDIILSQIGQSKTISIVAKAAGSNITHAYTIIVTRSPLLTSLGQPGSTKLSEDYSPTTYTYTLTIPSSMASVTLEPTVSQYCDELAIKCGNGEYAVQASQTVSPDIGETIPVLIRLKDTKDSVEQTYTVNVYRKAIITNIRVKDYPDIISFSPLVHAYDITVPANAGTIFIYGDGVHSCSTSVSIYPGETKTAHLITSSEDYLTTIQYDINVHCSKPLDSISVSPGTFNGNFYANLKSIDAYIASTVKNLTLSVTPNDTCSKLMINGTECTLANLTPPIGNSTCLVQATDKSSGVVTTYTVGIYRQPMLDNVTTSTGRLFPAFDATVEHYILMLPSNKDQADIEAAKSQYCNTVSFNGYPSERGLITVPKNTHKQLTITAQNYRGASSSYVIDIYNMNPITGIQASKGTLSAIFAAGTQNYTLTLPATESTTTITPVITDTCKSMSINGEAVSSKSFSLGKVGESTTATISITALDNTTSTYNLSIIRSALITNITTSPGALNSAFNPTTSSYIVDVPATATQVKITPVKARTGVKSISINGKSASSVTLKPAIGASATADITATATDGITSAKYTVTVRRAALVTNISVSAGSLTFSPTTMTYTVNVPADAGTITLNATQAASGVKSMTINGALTTSVNLTPPIGGTANATIIGTATGGKTKVTYTILVKRAPILSGVTPSTGALKPGFSSTTTSYTISLPATTSSLTLTPIKAADCAKLFINGIEQDAITVNPAVGESIPVVIEGKTALGTTATYNVKVTRAALITSITSGNKKYPLAPAFNTTTMNYTIDLPASVSSISIKAAKAKSEAKTLTFNQATASSFTAKPAAGGSIVVVIQAIAKDGVTKVTYTVTVRRAALP